MTTIKILGLLTGITAAYLLALNIKHSRWGFPLFVVSNVCWMYLAYQWNEVEMLLVNSAFASANFLGTLRYFSLPVSTPVDPNNQTEVEVRVKVLDANNTDSRLYVKDKPLIIKDASGKDYHMGQISSSVSWALRDVPENFSDDLDNLFPKGWVLHFVTL